jgi:hypothetical protein
VCVCSAVMFIYFSDFVFTGLHTVGNQSKEKEHKNVIQNIVYY